MSAIDVIGFAAIGTIFGLWLGWFAWGRRPYESGELSRVLRRGSNANQPPNEELIHDLVDVAMYGDRRDAASVRELIEKCLLLHLPNSASDALGVTPTDGDTLCPPHTEGMK